mmetsp:Transcript_4553/g.6307  ORF Transcript_4553/g.6307 Transcript_4553/m.6307 type:complete len:693 (-) Transcript_4553:104-2182(-)|eukprot:CAMPEP_0194047396 /NCGR_PEP_ID=MMETSP0009_2-20130614/24433_1 /TAXON_ID=210454 /ORGANISM="Grammatophora oceanica, Strain CCMP 410" /LENGTH=692 /DNA_ID=CAMNT_0038693007 /DNA_START=81 /DNA_END=2159 /DNA_ORIENTATION=+
MDASTAASSLLSEKKDFVLKLRLVGVGGPAQIRRVRLPRIAVNGSIDYNSLVSVAIQATFPDEGEILDFDGYDVALTYYDSDNDCITIGSTDELIDAIDQMDGVLRITTDVKRKKSSPAEKPQPRRVQAPAADVSAGGDAPAAAQPTEGASAPDINSGTPVGGRTVQLQSILESFVGILSVAVAALQTQLQVAGVPGAAPAPKVDLAPSPSAAPSASRGINLADGAKATPPVVSNSSAAADAAAPAPTRRGRDAEPAPEPRPFIHGRHTCDSCFTTPIVGGRYHATNLPDYDLCAKCHDSYMGSEIKFEPVELDRDRPFQERWHRKHSKFGGRGRCHGSVNRRRGGRGRFNAAAGPKDSNKNMDACLTEAIRRSLRDVSDAIEQASVAASSTAAVAPAKKKKVQDEPKKLPPKKEEIEVEATAPVEDEKKTEAAPVETEAEIVVAPMKTEAEIVVTKDEASVGEKVEPQTEFTSDAEGSGEIAAEIGRTLDDVASAISSVVTEIERSVKTTESDDAYDGGMSGVVVEEPVVEEDDVMPETEDIIEDEPETGATIVDGEDEMQDAASQGSDGSWDVVNEEDQLVQDEMLARAAQVIGSALFESATTGDQGSALTESVVSTVPTDVHSIGSSEIPAASRDRWSVQLTQLRELGFFDESKNVEILERLNAANIGCDSDDEVTMTQVVNELFKAGN